MASNNDFERRLASVEEQAEVGRTEAAAALVLAKCADRDVSHFQEKLTAQTRIIESIRQTQIDHGRVLGDHTKRLDSHEQRLDRLEIKVDNGFAMVEEQFAIQAAGQAQITALINRIIDNDK